METTELNIEQAIRDYLPKIVHMSLATSKDNKPWVCEVHFAYDDDLNLYFRSLTSRRHSQEIAENPHVAGNIVVQHQLGVMPMGAYFEGTARLLPSGPEQDTAFECIKQRLGAGDEIMEEARREDGHQFYKIDVQTWYMFGKLTDKVQKHELAWHRV